MIGDGCILRIFNINNLNENDILKFHKKDAIINYICKFNESTFLSGDNKGQLIMWHKTD